MRRGCAAFAVIAAVTLCAGLALAEVKGPMAKADSALLLLHSHHKAFKGKGELPKGADPFIKGGDVQITFQAARELSKAEIKRYESTGLRFSWYKGELLHVGPYYGVWIPFDSLPAFLDQKDVLRASSAWKPAIKAPLDVSVPEIAANAYWQNTAGPNQCTGSGMVIANFDTGIDITQPMFFKDDGVVCNWIDFNGNLQFDSGVDGVDFNGNTLLDPGEILRFFDGAGDQYGTIYWNDGVFDAQRDWLYNDANNNGTREFGAGAGYTDSTPSFGEQLFIVDDLNGNHVLDIGEQLIGLNTSKVAYALDSGGVTRTRGADIINTQIDTGAHGTSVAGILAGQNYNTDRQFIGVAPGADLLVVDRYGNNMATYLPWSRANGADVMLYEFCSYVFEYLDGSSAEEGMIDAEATTYGSAQITPAGNLADNPASDKHAKTNAPASSSVTLTTSSAPALGASDIWITILWRDTSNIMTVDIQNPNGNWTTLNATGAYQYDADGYRLWSVDGNSSRGTRKFDIEVNQNTNLNVDGTWNVRINNPKASIEPIHAYVADNITSWAGGFAWSAFNSNDGTICWPATADEAVTLASYCSRVDYGTPGQLSPFSSQGARIDGTTIMDIAAPGHWDIWTAMSKDEVGGVHGRYNRFGGTSASGPHVAAASALLMQMNPSWDHSDVKLEFHNSAQADGDTGVVPNDLWGYGKLRLVSPTYADTCAQADADPHWIVDVNADLNYAAYLNNAGYSYSYDQAGMCTGNPSLGPDVVIRVDNGGGNDKLCEFSWTPYTAADASTYLITDCFDPVGSCVAGADMNPGGVTESFQCCIKAGYTYYWILDGRNGMDWGPGYATITDMGLFGCYADTCAEADMTAIWTVDADTELDFNETIDTTGYTNDYTPWASGTGGCTGYAAIGPDVVVRINGGAFDRFCEFHWTIPTADSSTYLIHADCSDPINNCVAGSDADSGTGSAEIFRYCIKAGQTYYWILDGYNVMDFGSGTAMIFDIGVCLPDICPEADTSFYWTVASTADLPFSETINTVYKADDYTGVMCFGYDTFGNDAAIKIEGNSDATVRFEWGPTTQDAAIYLMTDCTDPTTCVAGADNVGVSGTEVFDYCVRTGEIYYLILDDKGGMGCSGPLQITDNGPCYTPTPLPTVTPTPTQSPAPTTATPTAPPVPAYGGSGVMLLLALMTLSLVVIFRRKRSN